MTIAGLPLRPGADLGILQSVDHVGDIAELDRRAVAKGDHDVPVSLGGGDLIVGRDGVGLMRTVERAFGAGDVGADDGCTHILQRKPVGGEPRQVGLDADRGPDPALNRDMADARHLGQPRGHDGVGHIAQRTQVDAL